MIIIEDGFSTLNKTGVGQYTDTLFKSIKILDLKVTTSKKSFLSKIKNKIVRRLLYNLWLNSFFLMELIQNKKDISIIFSNFAVPIKKIKNIKYISVIHDIYAIKYFQNCNKFTNMYEKGNITNAVKKADVIVTVSNTVRQELIDTYRIPSDRIKVVHNAVAEHFINAEFNPEILEKYGVIEGKYILSVATLNKRKNIPSLIEAFEIISDKYPDLKLVLVGRMGNESREKLTTHPNIIFTGYIKDEELPTLYKNAMFYVFPSVYEGFGTPLIEAQYIGCPVLCSDIPVFREVAGNGTEFTGTDSKSIANKMEYLINNEQKRNELRTLGYENVKRFDIEKIAEQLRKVIEN